MDKQFIFERIKAKHPDWSDDKIWTQVAVEIQGEIIVDKNPNGNFQDILLQVLEKAKEWLLEKLPEIFAKVVDFFDNLLNSLPEWAKNGLQKGFEYILRVLANSTFN